MRIVYLLIMQALLFSACCILPRKTEVKTEIEDHQATKTVLQNKRDMEQAEILASESRLAENEIQESQTLIINFDTSLPVDTVSGLHPVMSVLWNTAVKGRKQEQQTQTVRASVGNQKEDWRAWEVSEGTKNEKVVEQKETAAWWWSYWWVILLGGAIVYVVIRYV